MLEDFAGLNLPANAFTGLSPDGWVKRFPNMSVLFPQSGFGGVGVVFHGYPFFGAISLQQVFCVSITGFLAEELESWLNATLPGLRDC